MKCPHCNAESKTSSKCSNCGEIIVASVIKKRTRIPGMSSKRQADSYIYGLLSEAFLILNPHCGVAGCKERSSQVHHKKGRIGFADEWSRAHNITLYLDIRYFFPTCHNHHRAIEDNPEWAKENGYSEDRLAK